MREDEKSLNPDFSRRGFIGTALAATGFAVAAGPVNAQAISTDSTGLAAGPQMIGTLPAYVARPASGSNLPTILVVQEIFGVHEHIRDVCRRLAKLGYLAIAPELYFRQGDPSTVSDIPTLLKTIVAQVPDAQVLADLDAAAAWATSHGGDAKRLGITGFCWGGRISWLYAAHNPKLKAAVAWYGRLVGDASENNPRHPIDIAGQLKAPVLGLYGGGDQGIPLDSIERMRSAAKAAKVKTEIVVYTDAPHAFHADYRPSYRALPAQAGWQRLQDWFKTYL
ncbi:putative carboxymethylenebutenolidase precursor (Dienelactone hydrolase; DLH) [Magnetospirillum gryphiswaldense MSR-1 v2]|uniref:Carboxymethylenebutenolidase (Dienelactone hydrolase DLH) n=1 Tax=Magnetospirillum gryphiswaldense (strain DSM 6361 / JCM 21280 / NBRC 15271 / MSR-1) TaxID=431944 RepID=V6F627_MAGGM|nr:dienelactone hydrolase family protein [Magnetospirillum gryphiswaldense]CDL00894.1 putative carboxymethylenebutenolidase precursor (Dienelactone hydrolase; DLH) [Magnetospirillum gryphiswaldense MSR-1 v2]